ncbi:DnaT-like ssDNA-binding protein [Enterobacter hormaechei subsp. xiangfangensis]|uniref:DnaT-like ssDNA-binding protein n=1 Tax=Enterobacter hormaechei TaxID=158836 RepID=UPI003F434942
MINTDITSPDANSYVSEEDLASFAEIRGIELPGKLTPLLIKAMDYLEGLDWVGSKADPRQALAWPRVNVVLDEHDFPPDEVPRQVLTAQCMLAVAIKPALQPLAMAMSRLQGKASTLKSSHGL